MRYQIFLAVTFLIATTIPIAQAIGETKGRQRFLTWDYTYKNSLSTTKVGNKTDPEIESLDSKYSLEFGYNFGFLQPSLSLMGIKITSFDGTDRLSLQMSGGTLGTRLNFTENKSGNNFIPFTKIELGVFTGEGSKNDANKVALTGNSGVLSFGFDWFPFSEIFAVNYQLIRGRMTMKTDEADANLNTDVQISGSKIGFNLYF